MSRRFNYLFIMIILIQSNLTSNSAFGMTTLKPSVSISERYQSNVEASSTDETVSEDYETSISPRFSLMNEWESLSLTADYTLNSRFYSKDADRNYAGHAFSMGMEEQLTRKTSLSISDSYLYTKDSLEALDSQMEVGRDTIITNSASLSLSYMFTERVSSTVGISQRTSLYANSQLFDDRSDSFSLSLSDRLSQFLTLNLTYGYTVFTYEDGDSVNDRESHNLSLGITRTLARSLFFTFNVGANYIPEMKSDYDWTADAGISKSWQVTSLSLHYSRDVTNGGGLVKEVIINDKASLGLSFTLDKRTTLSLSGNYSRNKSKDFDLIDNYSYSYGFSSNWRPDELTAISLGATRFEQKTEDLLTREVKNNTVTLTLSITPDGWRF